MLTVQIFVGVVLAQFARAAILGSIWHIQDLSRYREEATGVYLGSSWWRKVRDVY